MKMTKPLTYEELEQKVKELEKEKIEHEGIIQALTIEFFKLREHFQKLPLCVYNIGKDGKIKDCNELVWKKLGYNNKDELIGKPLFTSIYAPSSQKKAKQLFLKWKKSGKLENEELQVITKQGKILDVLLNVETIYDSGGEVLYSISTQLDITRRKQVEEALQTSERKYQLLAESLVDGLYEFDLSGKITYVNEATAHMFGYSKEEILRGIWVEDIIAEKDKATSRDVIQDIIKGKKAFVGERTFIRKDGKSFIGEIHSGPIYRGKEVVGIRGVLRDISERKRAEKAMRESQKRLSQIVDGNSIATLVIDANHVVNYWNRACENLTNISAREIIGTRKQWSAFYSTERPVMADLIVENASKKEIAKHYGDKFRPSAVIEGAYEAEDFFPEIGQGGKWLFFTGAPLKDTEGNIIGAIETLQDITEQKRATEAIRESEERYRKVFENTGTATCIVEEDMTISMANTEHEKLTGYLNKDVEGKMKWSEFVHEEDLERMREYHNARREKTVASPKGYEFRLIDREGKAKDIFITVDVIPGTKRSVASLLDITFRKQTENALRESEEFNRALFEYNPIETIIVDLDARVKGFNLAKRDSGEKPPNIGDVMYWDYARKHEIDMHAELMECMRSSELKRFPDLRYGNKVLSITISPFDKGAIITTQDITAREQAKEALRESEEKYRLLVENANDAIFVVQDNVVKFPNPKAEEIIGYSAEELATNPSPEAIHPDDRDMVLDRYMRRLRGEDVPSTYSFRIIHRDGHEVWTHVNAVLTEWEGRPAVLCFLRDITEQKKLENQLFYAQKMEAVGTLAGGIAHDFHNLLMGIQGNISLMLLDIKPDQLHHERLRDIEQHVHSGADLTKQLLGFAMGGKYEVKPTDLNELMRKTSNMFARTRKQIMIHREYETDIWNVDVDQGQIEQVLLNLYVNAWQAMPGGGDLYLKTENITIDRRYIKEKLLTIKPGRYVKLSLADTGVGMDKKIQQRIFEPFFTTKERGRGTGLGLASAYGIIKNHGGIIDVFSEEGKGTTFTIYLPASKKEAIEKKELQQGLLEGTETILFVDDEETIREIGRYMLNKLGYTTLIAKSGEEAIDTYKRDRDKIAMVILDMVMPGIGGSKTYDFLKEIDPDVRVLLSSGYSINGQASEILKRGCNGFIQKPFNIHQLSQMIRKMLDENR
jgi:two-component system cell cycle sensor histidine kinase/response regulator CckA